MPIVLLVLSSAILPATSLRDAAGNQQLFYTLATHTWTHNSAPVLADLNSTRPGSPGQVIPLGTGVHLLTGSTNSSLSITAVPWTTTNEAAVENPEPAYTLLVAVLLLIAVVWRCRLTPPSSRSTPASLIPPRLSSSSIFTGSCTASAPCSKAFR